MPGRHRQQNLHRDTVDLTLTLFGIALFSSKEAHRLVIVDVLWAVYDGNHFALGTNGLTGTSVLDNFFEVALRLMTQSSPSKT